MLCITVLEDYYYYSRLSSDLANNSNINNFSNECSISSNANLNNFEGIYYANDDLVNNIEYIKYMSFSNNNYEIGHFNSVTKSYYPTAKGTYEITANGWIKFNNLPISQSGQEFNNYFIYSDNTLIFRNGNIEPLQNCSLSYSKLPSSFWK